MFLTYLTFKIAHAKLTPTKSRNLIRLKYAIFESEVKCIYRYHCLRFLFEFECQLLVLHYVMVMLKLPFRPFRWQVKAHYVYLSLIHI